MALSRIPSHQFTVDSNITIPTGKKLNAVDTAGLYAPGSIVQVIQSPLIGNLAANLTYTTTANQNNKSGYVALGSSYNFSITTKLANSKLLISGGLSMSGLTSHQFFDLYVTGAVTGWLSELHGGGAYDGLIANHITASDHYVRNSYELLYSPNLVAGATLTFAPYIGSWVGGTMYINQYPTSGNYNATHATGTIIREIAQ